MYWHVKNKDDLVVLAGDHVWSEIELPDPAKLGWRTAAAGLAAGAHAMVSRKSSPSSAAPSWRDVFR
jgi:hypothetical protein